MSEGVKVLVSLLVFTTTVAVGLMLVYQTSPAEIWEVGTRIATAGEHDSAPEPDEARGSFSRAADTAPPRLGEIEPSPEVDERLFLIRLLEAHYEAWPHDVSEPQRFAATVSELRNSALRIQQHIRDSELDPRLAGLYGDYVAALENYIRFLSRIEAIEADAIDQWTEDEFKSGFNAGWTGAATYQSFKHTDASSWERAGAGLAAAGITYLWDSYRRSARRERAQEEAVAAAARQVDQRIQAALGRAQNIARMLAKEHDWQRSEVGFDLSVERVERVRKLLESGNWAGLHRLAERQVELRPRDPFIRLTRNNIAALIDSGSATKLLAHAKDSYAMAALVPAPPVYDEYRLQCVRMAAFWALEARRTQIQQGTRPHGSTEISRYVVAVARKALALEPNDPTGEIRAHLAWAYMADDRLREAQEHADAVRDLHTEDAEFNYRYACLMSRRGHFGVAQSSLRKSIRQGWWDISHIRTDPNLSQLRQAQGTVFEELVTPQWTWHVTDDWMWDDIILTNRSDFALTSVKLEVQLMKDGQSTTVEVEVDYVGPGETYRWSDVVDGVTGEWREDSTAWLRCDQSP